MSTKAAKSIRTKIRLVNPAVRGWINYHGRFYRSQCVRVLQHLNKVLAAWWTLPFSRAAAPPAA
ncbi:MAG TPA: group II intron maturase-specific domain-containing protein [Thermoanaerobaculia bacterium]|nr:group II intron maturase-specific domain-containing protein [Thermoanaerobaculia bacterium]